MEDKDVAVLLAEVEARSKSNTKRLDRLEQTAESIHELAQSVAVMATAQEHLSRDVGEIKADVQTLKAVPGKRWEQVVDKLIFGGLAALLGAAVGLIVSRLF